MFNNVPANGWPQLKDLEKLDALAKQIENMPTFTSDDKAFLEDLPAYPDTDGTKMLTATTSEGNTSLSYEDIPEKLPADPESDGTRVLTATTSSGTTVKSWEAQQSMPDYSTTEQATGQKWIDGKDIYMKTLHVENAVMSGKNIEIDISSVSPDKCFIDYGASCAFDSDTNDWMSLSWVPAHAGVNYAIFAYADIINNGRKAVIISSAFDYGSRINDIYVTIRYTKATT